MRFDLGKLLFPKANPYERELKMAKLFFAIVGSAVLVGAVLFVVLGTYYRNWRVPLPAQAKAALSGTSAVHR